MPSPTPLSATPPGHPPEDTAQAQSSRVLLVEDEALIRSLAAESLRDAGHDVTEAANGDDAFALLRDGSRFDVLFTDIRMPGTLDGWALAEIFRERDPGIAVMYATGYSVNQSPVTRSLFYRKPYRVSDVLWGIRALTGARNFPVE